MSEIKITKDSLENAILRDGQFVSGYVENDNGYINASGYGAHAEGYSSLIYIDASGIGAHAEGIDTMALNAGAHAEGQDTIASGQSSHAEGVLTRAIGNHSHAGGEGARANQDAMTAIGKYNNTYEVADLSTLFVVGDGQFDPKLHNAFEVIENSSYSTRATVNGVSYVYLGCPIGTIVMWAGENAPEGWLLCDGEAYTISQYQDLYNVIGTKYGSSPTDNTFLVPNFQQKFPIGAEIGGVGNIIDKGTLKLYYSGTSGNWYYEGTIKIGQFLDLTSAQTILPHTSRYSDYCKIIDILGPNSISVIKCDSSGKTIDNTIDNLFSYYLYTVQQGVAVDDIKIKENKYSTILGSTGGEETHTLIWEEMKNHSHLGASAPIQIGGQLASSGSDHFVTGGASTSGVEEEESEPHNNIPPFLAINFIIKYK